MKGFIRKHRKKIIIISIILVIVIIVGAILGRRPKANTPAMERSTTVTKTLTKQTLTNSISVTGTLASAESKSVSVDLNNIEITEMNVAVGDIVKKGDVICTFDSSDIETELAKAKESLSTATIKSNMSLENAERNLENAEYTRDVEASRQAEKVSSAYDEYLESVNSEDEAEEAYISAKNAMDTAATKVETTRSARKKALNAFNEALASYQSTVSGNGEAIIGNDITIDTDFASLIASAASEELKQIYTELQTLQAAYFTKNEAYTKAQSTYATTQKNYNSAEAALTKATEEVENKLNSYTTTKQSADDSSRNNNNSVISQQNNLTSAQLDAATATDSQEETVENYETQLENCTLVAPMDGVITSLNFASGDTYTGGELLVIQDNSNFIVSATVDQYDISDIAKDMKAVIKTDTTEDLEMNGTVTFVSPTPQTAGNIGSSSTNYPLEITIEDASERLRIGMTAKVSIILESAEDVFAVPYDCIQTSVNGSSYIEVSDSSGETKNINVTCGMETDYYVEISGDELTEGMQVIVPGQVPATQEINMEDFTAGEFDMEIMGGDMPGGNRGGNRGNGMSGGGMGSGMSGGSFPR